MNWMMDLFQNPYLITSVSSWLIAQVLKVVIHFVLTKKWSLERLFGDGGMPSGHSATVASLAVLAGLINGADSFEFAVCGILAIIVCHDAMGVRLETGKQAVVINEIISAFDVLSQEKLPEVKLKEFVGHSPIQVSAGILIGIINAVVMYHCIC